MRSRLALLFLALTLTASLLFSQSTGRISGTVIDATNAAIPGAQSNLYMPGGASAIATTTTSQEGLFQFVGVQPINYDLSLESKGFQKQILRGIKVDAGLELSLPPITFR